MVSKIPLQLKFMDFNRVLFKTKKPFEKDWTNKPYTYDEISQYFPNENYGVMTGIKDYDLTIPHTPYRLGVLDDDTKDNKLMKLALESFGETFKVNEHLYFKFRNWDGQKIIFYDSDGEHLGELQGKGQMVVGPGSTHPSGRKYELRNNIPIVEIEIDAFKSMFRDFIISKKEVPKSPQDLHLKNPNFSLNSKGILHL